MRTLALINLSLSFLAPLLGAAATPAAREGKKRGRLQTSSETTGVVEEGESVPGRAGELVLTPSVQTRRSNAPGHMLAKH